MKRNLLGVRGFTLIELMVALAVAGIVLSLAAPPMQRLLYKNELRAALGNLLLAINLTRSEAIARNGPVSMCPSLNPGQAVPKCSGSYADGWIVFSNTNRDRIVNRKTDRVVAVFDGLPDGFTLTNRAGTRPANELITYLADGSSRRNRTLMICPPAGKGVSSVSVVMNRLGRPRKASSWGTCPA